MFMQEVTNNLGTIQTRQGATIQLLQCLSLMLEHLENLVSWQAEYKNLVEVAVKRLPGAQLLETF